MKTILLSIKPQYVAKILYGNKKVEYRTWIPKCEIPFKVLIYSSSPVRRVVAMFTVENIIASSPEILWNQTKQEGGVSLQDFDGYFKNRKIAYAFQISNLNVFENPMYLEDYGINTPPQRFAYI